MSANRIEALAKALYENGNPQHTAEDRAMLGPFEELDAMEQTIWMDLANAAHNHLAKPAEGTTDAGLANLIAEHWTVHEIDDDGDWITCDCGERFATPHEWATHLKSSVLDLRTALGVA